MKKNHHPTIGKGHGGNSNLPSLREVTQAADARQKALLALMEPGTRVFRMGPCLIFLSPPARRFRNPSGWHLSISRKDRYPSWDEVTKAWYTLVPNAGERYGAMLLPPETEYVNIHNFCFQIYELPAEIAHGGQVQP